MKYLLIMDDFLRKHHFINQKLEWYELFVSMVGIFSGMLAITLLSLEGGYPMMAPSFGATCVLIYAMPEAPVSQPKNVIMGHLNSALMGVIVTQILGINWISISFAVTLAIALMYVTNTLHPPGGATALIAALNGYGIQFIFMPILAGAILLVTIAVITNRLSVKRHYPSEKIYVKTPLQIFFARDWER